MISTGPAFAQNYYMNGAFGFRAQIPADWKTYAEVRDDGEGRAIIDWGLPKVYSELEKTQIENAVSITAYRRDSIRNIDDLIRLEFGRISPILISREEITSATNPTYVIVTERKRIRYKSRVVFVHRDGVGYVIAYTATPGTYEQNLPKFKSFISGMQLLPVSKAVKTAAAAPKPDFGGLYIAKTGSIEIGGSKTDIYTYLRFMADGTVYTQTVNSYDPASVSKWFGKDGRFERKGSWTAVGTELSFTVSNAESPDRELEGPRTDRFKGTIPDKSKLNLKITYDDGESGAYVFERAATN